jgi:DNA-binding MarR family transcriptional regulator
MALKNRLVHPEWLSPEHLEPWMSLVALITVLPAHLDSQLTRDSNITHFDYVVMSMLAEAPDRTLRITELAARTNGTLSRMSHVLDRLEKRALVKRVVCPEDARAKNAVLTRDGLATWLASAPKHLEEVRRVVTENLSSEQLSQLLDINRTLLSKLDPDNLVQMRKPAK